MNLTTYPYPSARRVLCGTRAAVASSQPLASAVGLDILQQGGNAVDAAIAMAIALTVVEPTANGIGGDCFALVWDGALHALNGSGRSPAAMTRDLYGDAIPETGWLTVTVPGAVSAWRRLWKRWGQLPFEKLFAGAIHYAEQGYLVSPVTAQAWQRQAQRFLSCHGAEYQAFQQVFFPQGRAPQAGERWQSPGHAATLRAIAQQGSAAFYRGELAEKMLSFAQTTGGLLSADDLSAHQADWVEPLSTTYRGVTVWEMPPNTQGIAALLALNILAGLDLASVERDSATSFHWQIEAMKLAFADLHAYVGDPETMTLTPTALLSGHYAEQQRSRLQPEQALPCVEPGIPGGGTVYLCTADGDLMVSLIQSNYEGFGSGILIPDTGIALHNRACGFTLAADHANTLAPQKRPFHTIIPGFLSHEDKPWGPFGVMGAQMQPQGHVQMVVNLVDYALNPQAALDAPRWRFLRDNQVWLESGVAADMAATLTSWGHQVTVTPDFHCFGKGQIILRAADGFLAGSEPRADGCALVI